MQKSFSSTFNASSKHAEKELERLALGANREILEHVRQDPDLEGIGSTVTVVFIGNRTAHWVNVGDSRLYLIREGVMVQVTDDHTVPGMMLQEGELEPEEARLHPMRNMLLSCLGREEFQMDSGSFGLGEGDLLLLSTDGLHDCIPEEDISSVVLGGTDLEPKLTSLVDAALAAGGRDSITAVAMEI